MTTDKRIDIAARLIAGWMAGEYGSMQASAASKASIAREAFAWADAIEAEATKGIDNSTIYKWEEAPKLAKFAATDSDGNSFWWSGKPDSNIDEWNSRKFDMMGIANRNRSVYWLYSLEARP